MQITNGTTETQLFVLKYNKVSCSCGQGEEQQVVRRRGREECVENEYFRTVFQYRCDAVICERTLRVVLLQQNL